MEAADVLADQVERVRVQRLRSAGPREYAIHEWEYGGYERSVETPDGFGSGVEASLANGQLVVRVLRGDFTVNQRIHPTSN